MRASVIDATLMALFASMKIDAYRIQAFSINDPIYTVLLQKTERISSTR